MWIYQEFIAQAPPSYDYTDLNPKSMEIVIVILYTLIQFLKLSLLVMAA